MECPTCRSPMLVVEYDGIELDHCPRCEGTWFDSDELALLFDGAGDAVGRELDFAAITELPDAATDEASRRCPRCRKRMRKVDIGPGGKVLVDVCGRGHGLWFDRGEVADLAADLRLGGDDLPARALAFLGGMIGRGDAAAETEERT